MSESPEILLMSLCYDQLSATNPLEPVMPLLGTFVTAALSALGSICEGIDPCTGICGFGRDNEDILR